MRMAKVSVSIPDAVVAAAKARGLNISRVATEALVDELDRQSKVAQLDAYLAQLAIDLGPVSATDAAEASAWADQIEAATRDPRS